MGVLLLPFVLVVTLVDGLLSCKSGALPASWRAEELSLSYCTCETKAKVNSTNVLGNEECCTPGFFGLQCSQCLESSSCPVGNSCLSSFLTDSTRMECRMNTRAFNPFTMALRCEPSQYGNNAKTCAITLFRYFKSGRAHSGSVMNIGRLCEAECYTINSSNVFSLDCLVTTCVGGQEDFSYIPGIHKKFVCPSASGSSEVDCQIWQGDENWESIPCALNSCSPSPPVKHTRANTTRKAVVGRNEEWKMVGSVILGVCVGVVLTVVLMVAARTVRLRNDESAEPLIHHFPNPSPRVGSSSRQISTRQPAGGTGRVSSRGPSPVVTPARLNIPPSNNDTSLDIEIFVPAYSTDVCCKALLSAPPM